MSNLKVIERVLGTGHSARRLRNKGFVPGVIYGKEIGNMLFEVGELEISKEISSCGEHGVLSLNIDGKNKNVHIKEVQREPVNHKIIHIDLEEIEKGELITAEIPISFEGEGYLSKNGAVLQKERAAIKIECDPLNMPKSVIVDVSKGVGGSVYRAYDIESSNELSIVDELDSIIASVSYEQKLDKEDLKEAKEAKETKKEESN